jgi:hypothetical protein
MEEFWCQKRRVLFGWFPVNNIKRDDLGQNFVFNVIKVDLRQTYDINRRIKSTTAKYQF